MKSVKRLLCQDCKILLDASGLHSKKDKGGSGRTVSCDWCGKRRPTEAFIIYFGKEN